jgi:glycosyltransferase involved in cell wall biosynthesis
MGEKRTRGSVAVVIPCFNDGATLVDAVASAQSQDVPAEIIIVDDGSTDEATMALTELRAHDQVARAPSEPLRSARGATGAPRPLPGCSRSRCRRSTRFR